MCFNVEIPHEERLELNMATIYIKACHWLSSWYLLGTDSQTSYNNFVIDNFHSYQLQFQMTPCIDKHIAIFDWTRIKIIWKQFMHMHLPFMVYLGMEQMWLVEIPSQVSTW